MKRSWGLGKVGKDDGALVEKWGEGWVNKVHETKESVRGFVFRSNL